MGKITEEKNNVGDNNEERDTFNDDIKETSSRVRLRKPKKKVSLINFVKYIGVPKLEYDPYPYVWAPGGQVWKVVYYEMSLEVILCKLNKTLNCGQLRSWKL